MTAVVPVVEIRGASDRVYRLKFGLHAWLQLEAWTGQTQAQILAALRRRRPAPPLTLVRDFLRAGLVEPAHPTADEVDEILEDIVGGPENFAAAGFPPAGRRTTRAR